MKYFVDGNYIEAHVGDLYYCTNKSGNGLFVVDHGDRRQLLGTAQFSVRNVSDKKGKLRRYLNQIL